MDVFVDLAKALDTVCYWQFLDISDDVEMKADVYDLFSS